PVQQVKAAGGQPVTGGQPATGGQPQVVQAGMRTPDEPASDRTAADVAGAGEAGPGHLLQLGAFRARENAQAAAGRLARQLEPLRLQVRMTQQDGLYRVQAGPYGARDDAVRA